MSTEPRRPQMDREDRVLAFQLTVAVGLLVFLRVLLLALLLAAALSLLAWVAWP